jgi:hypothetical protein
LDKFSFLACTLASAAPIINQHRANATGNLTQDSIVVVIRVLKQIIELLATEQKSLDDDNEMLVFKKKAPKITQEDDEGSYKDDSNHSESEKRDPVSPAKRKRGRPSKPSLEPPKKKVRFPLNQKEVDEGAKSWAKFISSFVLFWFYPDWDNENEETTNINVKFFV